MRPHVQWRGHETNPPPKEARPPGTRPATSRPLQPHPPMPELGTIFGLARDGGWRVVVVCGFVSGEVGCCEGTNFRWNNHTVHINDRAFGHERVSLALRGLRCSSVDVDVRASVRRACAGRLEGRALRSRARSVCAPALRATPSASVLDSAGAQIGARPPAAANESGAPAAHWARMPSMMQDFRFPISDFRFK